MLKELDNARQIWSTYMDGDIIVISGVERSLNADDGVGVVVRSGLQDEVFAGIRDRKQMGSRGPFETPVLPIKKFMLKDIKFDVLQDR